MATVTRIGSGMYRVEIDGRQSIVYVAGSENDLWAFADGETFREHAQQGPPKDQDGAPGRHDGPPKGGHYVLSAPMPATVVKILVAPGQTVRHGDTLVVLEAMKMELPIRAPGDGTVKAINCREGELVQPDRAIIEME